MSKTKEEMMDDSRLQHLEDLANTSEGMTTLEGWEMLREIRRARAGESEAWQRVGNLEDDIAALEAQHAAEIAKLNAGTRDLCTTVFGLRGEIDRLRAKMAGMVCGRCRGLGQIPDPELFGALILCPDCPPKEVAAPSPGK